MWSNSNDWKSHDYLDVLYRSEDTYRPQKISQINKGWKTDNTYAPTSLRTYTYFPPMYNTEYIRMVLTIPSSGSARLHKLKMSTVCIVIRTGMLGIHMLVALRGGGVLYCIGGKPEPNVRDDTYYRYHQFRPWCALICLDLPWF